MKIPTSENQKKRCRYMLKPFISQNVLVYACLTGGVLEEDQLKKHPEKNQLALFTDVKIIKNADNNNVIDLDLDHVHVQIKNKHLAKLKNSYFSFKATIYQYETQYENKPESRYGLTNFQIQPLKKGLINDLVLQYRNQVTAYQKVLIQHLRPWINKKYRTKQLNNNQIIGQKLLSYTDFRQRTKLLETNLNQLENGNFMDPTILSWFSNPKLPSLDKDQDYKSKYLNLKSQFDQLKIRYKKQQHQFQKQTKLYAETIAQQNKNQPKSLWSAIKQYFKHKRVLKDIQKSNNSQSQNDTKGPETNQLIDKEKLAELQAHFNAKN